MNSINLGYGALHRIAGGMGTFSHAFLGVAILDSSVV